MFAPLHQELGLRRVDPLSAARRVPRAAAESVRIFSSRRAFVGRYALCKLLIASAAEPWDRRANRFSDVERSNASVAFERGRTRRHMSYAHNCCRLRFRCAAIVDRMRTRAAIAIAAQSVFQPLRLARRLN
jgi:hypothetical protein